MLNAMLCRFNLMDLYGLEGPEVEVEGSVMIHGCIPWAPKTMKVLATKKNRLFTMKTSKHVGFGGPFIHKGNLFVLCFGG